MQNSVFLNFYLTFYQYFLYPLIRVTKLKKHSFCHRPTDQSQLSVLLDSFLFLYTLIIFVKLLYCYTRYENVSSIILAPHHFLFVSFHNEKFMYKSCKCSIPTPKRKQEHKKLPWYFQILFSHSKKKSFLSTVS